MTPTPKPKELIEQAPIEGLLRDIARKRTASMRWNTHTMLMFYALLVIVALLRLEGVNIYVVMALASAGLLIVWFISRMRWKKLETKLYKEELDNFQKMVAIRDSESITVQSEKHDDSPLSDRELEVLVQIAEGMINKQIAITLGISTQTVKNHISHILTKLGVEDRTSAVLFAVAHGWISIDSPAKKEGKKSGVLKRRE
jgi:DNA-binding CsgD family transcriptional regulator